MKKIVIALLSLLIAPAIFAQGSFFYNNYGGGFVYAPGGVQLAGPAYTIDIFWGAVGTPEDSLVALNSPVQLQGAGLEGYFDGGTAVIPTALTSILVQYRAIGAGIDTVLSRSQIVTQPLAAGVGTPADQVATANWTIVPVPEPSAFALAGLSSVALLIFRRRS